MRDKVDKVVKDIILAEPGGYRKLPDVQRMSFGKVKDLSSISCVKYNDVDVTTLEWRVLTAADAITAVDDKKKRFQMAVIGLVNTGSLYISIAAQYVLYCITTTEIPPCTLEETVSRSCSSIMVKFDMKVLKNIVDTLMKGYNAYVGEDLNTVNDLVSIAKF